MKKLFFAALFIIVGTSAFGQKTSFNVKAGLNLANWIGSDVPDEAKVKAGFKVGVGMEYRFNDLISLQPSLMFATKGSINKRSDLPLPLGGEIGIKVTTNQMYVELPVMVAFRFNIVGSTNIVLSVGPYIGYGVGGKVSGKITSGKDQVANVDEFLDELGVNVNTFGKDRLNAFDAGVGVGVAVEFGRFFAGLDTEMGLTKLLSDSKANNISVGVGVGFRF